MKKNILALLFVLITTSSFAQNISFVDPNFKTRLLDHQINGGIVIDTNNDNEISVEEAAVVTDLRLQNSSISNLSGLENFISVTSLNLDGNNLTIVDVSMLQNISEISFQNNVNISALNLSSIVSLTSSLIIDFFGLTALDLSNLVSVDGDLEIEFAAITGTIELPVLTSVSGLFRVGSTDISALIAPNLESTGKFSVMQNTDMITASFPNLLSTSDFKMSSNFELNSVDFSSLEVINGVEDSGGLEYAMNQNLVVLSMPSLTSVFGEGGIEFDMSDNDAITAIELPNLTTVSGPFSITGMGDNMTTLAFPALETVDSFDCTFCDGVTTLSMPSLVTTNAIDFRFGSLESANLSALQTVNSIDFSLNFLTLIDLSSIQSANTINLRDNNLATIGLTNQDAVIGALNLFFNNFTELDLTNYAHIDILNVNNNELTSLNLTGMTELSYVFANDNVLLDVQFPASSELIDIRLNNNELVAVDFSLVQSDVSIEIDDNALTYINLKNGFLNADDISFEGNPDLEFICVDLEEQENINSLITTYGYAAFATDYCSFTPGGDYFTMQGRSSFALDAASCTTVNTPLPFFKFNTTNNGIPSGIFYSNFNGDYSHNVNEGAHVIVPDLENPDYFNSNPSSISATFPQDVSPSENNFCFTPNGNIRDLEVVFVPTSPARPGFEASYNIIYRNKGNQIQDGTITLQVIQIDRMSLLDVLPMPTTIDGQDFTWNFTALAPFETRMISLSFLLNTPTDTPPVNIGDDLGFDANIFPITDDAVLQDNSSELKQTVVGSYDPNDILCLQGEEVAPQYIDAFVNYRIRFENTGTFAAENIVIVNEIDPTTFDISTLQPIYGSHDFVTRIVEENKVEFIFENIQLPFEEALNDGYLVYKIKTLPSLQIGDSFSNQAAIYFDFNPPIITNEYTSIITETLGADTFALAPNILLYPIPAKDQLILQFPNGLEVFGTTIYNLLGEVQEVSSNNHVYTISSLASGVYFMSIVTNQGTIYKRFIKD